jgi:hypothetical protein
LNPQNCLKLRRVELLYFCVNQLLPC